MGVVIGTEHSQIDDPHLILLQRIPDGKCRSAAIPVQITDAQGRPVSHKTVPCQHDTLEIKGRDNRFLICLL